MHYYSPLLVVCMHVVQNKNLLRVNRKSTKRKN